MNGSTAVPVAESGLPQARVQTETRSFAAPRTRPSGPAPLARIALIGNALPRRCGIATFTTDLQNAMSGSREALHTSVVAMNDDGQVYDYPASVGCQIDENNPEDYRRATDFLNDGQFDVVSLQHEFGIFGGEAGDLILPLVRGLDAPLVTTLHTVLADPSAKQSRVLSQIVEASTVVVVMAEKARTLLRERYGVPDHKIEVIPHGIPDIAYSEPGAAKAALGFSGRSVILTFGLLSPNKGVEVMIDAMPAILERRPDAVYVVLGATHPHLVRREGEAYRESLIARARDRGVEGEVVFLDQFVDQARLLAFISMADVYVTPYLNEAQMTSGTLAYSFGLGKAVVSTPYWHARELLADGKGVLVPFGDASAIGEEIADLLTDPDRRDAMRRRAYAGSRAMTWARVAERYFTVFERARAAHRFNGLAPVQTTASSATPRLPDLQFGHLIAMCDDTGLAQHAVHSVVDRAHGYCVDDNARALLLACMLGEAGETGLPDSLSARFAAFVQHAWNPDNRRFRNFMSFDREWLEPMGSQDSHGRTLWALGVSARCDPVRSRRAWAADLFLAALGGVEDFSSPRAWAFTLLGLAAYCQASPGDEAAERMRSLLAERLLTLLEATETPDWVWFEDGLSYDNARLPESLIVSGLAMDSQRLLAAGLRSLTWLMTQQTAPSGRFRPVGSQSFGELRRPPRAFDQQPLEAAATISACLAAGRADDRTDWKAQAHRAFGWFVGDNDLGMSLIDPADGGCRDGLHPDRVNQNRGAESVVSYMLSLAMMRRLGRARRSGADQLALPASFALPA